MIAKIQPIAFTKKYKKPRTVKREIQKTQIQAQTPKMGPEASRAELAKQADYALKKANVIKQNANTVKIRSYEVIDKAKRNIEFANGLFSLIKANATRNNFSIQYEGTTYKVEINNGKCRAIGQSRGFFGKKDIFEYDLKNDKLNSIFKGYAKETDKDSYSAQEEYHNLRGSILDVFFDVSTNKLNKNIKEGFSFYSDNMLSSYFVNAKVALNDFEFGEYEQIYNYDTISGAFSNCNIGLNCSKNAFTFKKGYHFINGKLESYIRDCKAKSKGYDSSVCTSEVMIHYTNNKPEVGYMNYRVVDEKASFDYEYEFQSQPAFN